MKFNELFKGTIPLDTFDNLTRKRIHSLMKHKSDMLKEEAERIERERKEAERKAASRKIMAK